MGHNIIDPLGTPYIAEDDYIEGVAVLANWGWSQLSFGLFAVYFFDGSK